MDTVLYNYLLCFIYLFIGLSSLLFATVTAVDIYHRYTVKHQKQKELSSTILVCVILFITSGGFLITGIVSAIQLF